MPERHVIGHTTPTIGRIIHLKRPDADRFNGRVDTFLRAAPASPTRFVEQLANPRPAAIRTLGRGRPVRPVGPLLAVSRWSPRWTRRPSAADVRDRQPFVFVDTRARLGAVGWAWSAEQDFVLTLDSVVVRLDVVCWLAWTSS